MVTNINLQIIAETVTRKNVPLQSPSKHRPEKKKKGEQEVKKKGKEKKKKTLLKCITIGHLSSMALLLLFTIDRPVS